MDLAPGEPGLRDTDSEAIAIGSEKGQDFNCGSSQVHLKDV